MIRLTPARPLPAPPRPRHLDRSIGESIKRARLLTGAHQRPPRPARPRQARPGPPRKVVSDEAANFKSRRLSCNVEKQSRDSARFVVVVGSERRHRSRSRCSFVVPMSRAAAAALHLGPCQLPRVAPGSRHRPMEVGRWADECDQLLQVSAASAQPPLPMASAVSAGHQSVRAGGLPLSSPRLASHRACHRRARAESLAKARPFGVSAVWSTSSLIRTRELAEDGRRSRCDVEPCPISRGLASCEEV